ncbi:MAG: pyrroline-5-carboxylate reductase [Armatimonadetes bacterium]|nr:pyrroline-5-carboxylate reductase [Armatimonadota bacterium]
MDIGIIGIGKVGEAIAVGLRDVESQDWNLVGATTATAKSAQTASERIGIPVTTDSRALATSAKVLLLCVKPYQAQKALEAIAQDLTAEHLVISVAAGVTVAQLTEWSGGKPHIVRAMPNTPALIGQGMTVIASGPEEAQIAKAIKIFECVGKTATVAEHLMDGVTGLSGCGPAYIYVMIEALSEAGVSVGLPRDVSTLLAAQTMLGSAQMVLERGRHPAMLKDEVTTPAGCTIDGLIALEEGKMRATLIRAVRAATDRSKTLGSS